MVIMKTDGQDADYIEQVIVSYYRQMDEVHALVQIEGREYVGVLNVKHVKED